LLLLFAVLAELLPVVGLPLDSIPVVAAVVVAVLVSIKGLCPIGVWQLFIANRR
jgi:hypothetical protein